MRPLDLVIIFGYLVGITVFGIWFAGRQETTEDYFVGDRSVPWWAIAASIVATETSTITFISVPGVAFARGGNFQFLQLVFGYMLGRIVISFLFIPSYFRGELLTVYQLLERRFGGRIKMLAAALFVIMRNIADGIRLLLTAIVLAAVYVSFQPPGDVTTATVTAATIASIVLLGVVMIVFTYYGGMEAVIWVEVVQLGIYLAGALAAAVVIANSTAGGFSGAIAVGKQFAKFDVIDFGIRQTSYAFTFPFTAAKWTFSLPIDLTKSYTFWAGLVGGCFLTMSTHGTDQYLVQRYLCTDRPRRAAAALLSSGAVVLAQFIGFLFIGVLLFAFYGPHASPLYTDFAAACAQVNPLEAAGRCLSDPAFAQTASATFPFAGGDRVFPDFITKHMPSGLSGLVVAAIFAAALSSSLNSIAATAVNDLYKPFRREGTDRHYLRVSQWLTLIWGIVQIAVAIFAMSYQSSALDKALSVASLINGPVLGVFLVGTFLRRVSEPPALIGMLTSIVLMLYVRFWTPLAWTWYVLLGSLITFAVAWGASYFFAPASAEQRDELSPGAAD
jgi:SSS family transporter